MSIECLFCTFEKVFDTINKRWNNLGYAEGYGVCLQRRQLIPDFTKGYGLRENVYHNQST